MKVKLTKKEMAVETDRDRLYIACCLALKYKSLRDDANRTGVPIELAKPNEDTAMAQLVDFMGYKHADAVVRFARLLP